MRISEMMDHSSEILEHDMACDFMVDEDRIKQIVFYKIGCSRVKNGRRSKKRYAAIFVATLGIGGMTAWAHSILKSAGEINGNKNEVLESQEGISISENMEDQEEIFEPDTATEWITDENLCRDGVPIAKYIIEVPIQKDGTVPECYYYGKTKETCTPSTNYRIVSHKKREPGIPKKVPGLVLFFRMFFYNRRNLPHHIVDIFKHSAFRGSQLACFAYMFHYFLISVSQLFKESAKHLE